MTECRGDGLRPRARFELHHRVPDVRIVNPNPTAVRVAIHGRSLTLGDDGKVVLGARPDPRWRGRAHFPRGLLRIPASGWLDLRLVVDVPRRLQPDLYFVGFLVTPVPESGGSITVVNQIGSFVTLDVPGPRLRRLSGRLDLPGFVLGSRAAGTLRLTNTGHASVSFWGEADTTSTPGGAYRQERLDARLLPVGRSRSVAVTGRPRWPVGFVTVTTRITYPGRTEAETRQLVFRQRVLVVSPWLGVGAAALLAVAAGWWVARRRRRRRSALRPVWNHG